MEYEISPEDFGLPRHAPDGLLGGDAHLNARILRDILTGKERGAVARRSPAQRGCGDPRLG